MYVAARFCSKITNSLNHIDIIALLVIGVLFIALFIVWQGYLERVQNDPTISQSKWIPPPLMKLSLWTRGRGRFAAVMVIVLLTWCSFVSWNYWSQVYSFHLFLFNI